MKIRRWRRNPEKITIFDEIVVESEELDVNIPADTNRVNFHYDLALFSQNNNIQNLADTYIEIR